MIERPKSQQGAAAAEQQLKEPIVFIIDDDLSVRRALTNLFGSVGLHVEAFGSAPEMLQHRLPDVASCLVLDIRLPGLSGLDLQTELAKVNINIPIIFITGHGDIPMSVQAMKMGAIEFLTKPFRDQDLIDAVKLGLARDRARREDNESVIELRARLEALTPRELSVLTAAARGQLNKQIAADMGITESTVKVHRANMMRKMRLASFAEVCRAVHKLKLLPEQRELP